MSNDREEIKDKLLSLKEIKRTDKARQQISEFYKKARQLVKRNASDTDESEAQQLIKMLEKIDDLLKQTQGKQSLNSQGELFKNFIKIIMEDSPKIEAKQGWLNQFFAELNQLIEFYSEKPNFFPAEKSENYGAFRKLKNRFFEAAEKGEIMSDTNEALSFN